MQGRPEALSDRWNAALSAAVISLLARHDSRTSSVVTGVNCRPSANDDASDPGSLVRQQNSTKLMSSVRQMTVSLNAARLL